MIAALHRCSFVDFPGHVSAVVFTRGCNLRCRYCHNPELCLPGGASDCDLQSVMDFLDTRRGKLTGVVVSGGEPTLHEALPAMLAAIRARGFAVKLDTNGMLPQVVKHIVDCGLIDDIVRGKFDFDVVGHYARPDVFRLYVNEGALSAVVSQGGDRPREVFTEAGGTQEAVGRG